MDGCVRVAMRLADVVQHQRIIMQTQQFRPLRWLNAKCSQTIFIIINFERWKWKMPQTQIDVVCLFWLQRKWLCTHTQTSIKWAIVAACHFWSQPMSCHEIESYSSFSISAGANPTAMGKHIVFEPTPPIHRHEHTRTHDPDHLALLSPSLRCVFSVHRFVDATLYYTFGIHMCFEPTPHRHPIVFPFCIQIQNPNPSIPWWICVCCCVRNEMCVCVCALCMCLGCAVCGYIGLNMHEWTYTKFS